MTNLPARQPSQTVPANIIPFPGVQPSIGAAALEHVSRLLAELAPLVRAVEAVLTPVPCDGCGQNMALWSQHERDQHMRAHGPIVRVQAWVRRLGR